MLGIFKGIQQHKENYLRAETGKEFEDRFEHALRESYSKILPGDIAEEDFKLIKEFIIKKQDTGFLPFKKHPKTFLRAAFGSQSYPDFLIFTGKYVVPVEIKYSKKKQTRPMWNSGIPRANGFYIFGSYQQKDITFFLGKDILNNERRSALIGFFQEIKERESKFKKFARKKLPDEERRGFMPYIRRAYAQEKIAKRTELNYFTHPDRQTLESEVVEMVNRLL